MTSHPWWESLKHGGLLIAPSRLVEHFPADPEPLAPWIGDHLRRAVLRADVGELLDAVFETVCGVNGSGQWFKANQVPPEYTLRSLTGATIKPRRVWRGPHGAVLPVFFDDSPRLGIGRGRVEFAHVVDWLRRAQCGFGVLTNGRQFRLIHAGLDYDAWAEWDSDLWFEEGQPGQQVTALRSLLSATAITPKEKDKPSPLLAAILATRKGQAELSAELGERVRQAVEILIRAHTAGLDGLDQDVKPRHVYLAAVRVVMRMVVALFAEARELLPRGNPVYEASYGIQALREQLDRLGQGSGAERLRHRYGAWPRLLALFRLIHDGSGHAELPITRYDGGLFTSGAQNTADPVARVVSVFEDPAHAPSDAVVYQILDLLTRSRVKVRQGLAATWVMTPVDFSDLSSEYIGILYEGLLDYELRRAAADDPVVFLRIGDEPALPLSRLEGLDKKALSSLLNRLKTKNKTTAESAENAEEEEGDEVSEDEEGDEVDVSDVPIVGADAPDEIQSADDISRRAQERAMAWARKAAGDQATDLIDPKRVVVPGQWYLVRFGGTRKGSGTFYTRPALAVPTAHRTLRPLAYTAPLDAAGQPDELAAPKLWKPRLPEEILALKVCDPACGSGSFLVAALRFLTEALAESLHHHGRIAEQGDRTLVTLAEGKPGGVLLKEDLLPCRPSDPEFQSRLRARLKRYVVEHCLYGVDLDPLAIELCRLALWVETMDRELPFTFLDHKIRPGNALVGCWFDRFRDYPALAWDREGGDKGHKHGTHFEDAAWTKAIKAFRDDSVKPALVEMITGQASMFVREGKSPEEIHDQAIKALQDMHGLAPGETEERATLFRTRIAGNPGLIRLKESFHTWCALWFWPPDKLDDAPLPHDFSAPSANAGAIVAYLANEHGFFHWELEFPDVFARADSGFDAMLGNPPWEIQKPNSKEYFSNLDPLYRTYGKQEALRRQEEIFEGAEKDEREWLTYCGRYKALANFLSSAADPFSLSLGRGAKDLYRTWATKRARRTGYADPAHPFRYQGSADINTYKLFLESSYAALRAGGRLGLIVPSGLYTDKGTTELRKQLLFHARWRWLFGFENRDGIFDIHRSFKFCPVIIEKAGETDAVHAAFMRRDVDDWAVAERLAVPYERKQVERFSPKTFAILEIRNRRDLEILEKMYANGVLLGDQSDRGWGIKYATEFHMTNDSKLFPPRPEWEEKGYRGDEYGRWLLGEWRAREKGSPGDPGRARWELDAGVILSQDGELWIHEDEVEDVALPLYEGRMIGQFDFSQKGWVSGKARSAVWEDIPFESKRIQPQYLIPRDEYTRERGEGDKGGPLRGPKVAFMDVTSATNARTMIACVVDDMPCGNSAPVLQSSHSPLALSAILNSFVYDSLARSRCGGLHLNYFVVEETSLAKPIQHALQSLEGLRLRLTAVHPAFAALHLRLRGRGYAVDLPRSLAISEFERVRLRVQGDAIAAALLGLDWDDLRWLLQDCDLPAEVIRRADVARSLSPKGFWRIGKEHEPELRATVLTLVAFRELSDTIRACQGDAVAGVSAWLCTNDGNGWMPPDTLRLADYGLGHDDRAKQHQPVAERLGPRFLPWQLEQTAEESWRECELHARNLLGEVGFGRLKEDVAADGSETTHAVREQVVRRVAEPPHTYEATSRRVKEQPGLFE